MPKNGNRQNLMDRTEVLECIAQCPGINLTRLGRETGLNWSKLDKLLSELVQENIVREERLVLSNGRRVRLFFLTEDDGGGDERGF